MAVTRLHCVYYGCNLIISASKSDSVFANLDRMHTCVVRIAYIKIKMNNIHIITEHNRKKKNIGAALHFITNRLACLNSKDGIYNIIVENIRVNLLILHFYLT